PAEDRAPGREPFPGRPPVWHAPWMGTNPFELLTRSQRAALNLTTTAFNSLVEAGRAGITAPEEIATQVTDLLGALGNLAGATAQPLQDFVTRQRELADT